MSRFLAGVLILLFVLVVTAVVALIGTDVTSGTSPPGCTDANNLTTCESVSKTTFFVSLLSVSVSGINGAPSWFNIVYLLIMATLLTAGIILIVISFIPTLGN
jgi:hypothetical protein